ncbi:MAG: type I-D CRISPR-associated protein Cas7/Csc2 [Candidatus Lokiarchaeota archaeon]|nr:type I-D CRISPR-associated protein Cas7/Csc2 [Candidatus Lokiarchaeota archaeon]
MQSVNDLERRKEVIQVKIELLDNQKDWFVGEPSPLAPAKYASVALLRTTKDYAAFRTEADKYTNSVATPAYDGSDEVIERALILASKQKAVERRHQSKILRAFPQNKECYLKDELCLSCPVCALNGGISTKTEVDDISIKSRILYQTAFSVMPFEDVVESITFNAVNEKTTKTGQALGERELVKPDTSFLSVVTLLAPTLDELKFYLYAMLNTTRYGAETRGLGVIDNRLLGLVLSGTEEFSALQLTMDTYGNLVAENDDADLTYDSIFGVVHEVSLSDLPEARVHKVYSKDKIPELEKALKESSPTEDWIDGMYEKALAFRKTIEG